MRAPGVSGEQLLEIAQVLGHPQLQKIRGSTPRLFFLILVVEAGGYRVVRIVRLAHQIRQGELQLLRPEPPSLTPGRKTVAGAQVLQNVGSLADEEWPGLQERWCKGRALEISAVEKEQQRPDSGSSARLPRHVTVRRAGFFQA